MLHRSDLWADQGERPLRYVNVAEVLGTALRRSLVSVTFRQERCDRLAGDYLDGRYLLHFDCERLRAKGRGRDARRASTQPDLRSAMAYFVSRVQYVPEVRAVVRETRGAEPRLVTFIEQRDMVVRSRIYEIESEIYDMFSGLALDFRVVSLDSSARTLPVEEGDGVQVLFQRPST